MVTPIEDENFYMHIMNMLSISNVDLVSDFVNIVMGRYVREISVCSDVQLKCSLKIYGKN